MPRASTAEQSSVRARPCSAAFWSAPRSRSASKTCGVCTANSVSRRGVASTAPDSDTLIVSLTGMAGAAAPNLAAFATAFVMTSAGTSGRAPSWTATSCVPSETAARPFCTDSVRLAPPETTMWTFSYATHTRLMRSMTSGRVTTMISSMAGWLLNAASVRQMTGSFAMGAKILSTLPMRVALPAATMTAAVYGCSSFCLTDCAFRSRLLSFMACSFQSAFTSCL